MKSNKKYVFYIIMLALILVSKKISHRLISLDICGIKFSVRYSIAFISIYTICMIIPLIVFLTIKKVSLQETLKLKKINLISIVMIIVIAILFYPFLCLISDISAKILGYNISEEVTKLILDAPLSILVFQSIMLAPIVEELIFRGVMLRNNIKSNVILIIVTNGFLFALFHMNLQQFFYTFFMGMLFTMLVIVTNSIFSSIIAHVTINGIDLFISYIGEISINNQVKNNISTIPEDAVAIPNIFVYLIIATFFSLGYFLLIKLQKNFSKLDPKVLQKPQE